MLFNFGYSRMVFFYTVLIIIMIQIRNISPKDRIPLNHMRAIISNILQMMIVMEDIACTPWEHLSAKPREVITTMIIDIAQVLEENPRISRYNM